MEHSTPRVTIHMAASLDGFIARNNGAVDWMETADTFEGGDTMAPEFVAAFLATINCYVMGSRTYETALDFEARGMGGRSLGPRQSRLDDILVTNPRETAMFAELIAVNRIDTQSGEGYEGRIGKGRTMEIAGLSGQPESVLEQAAAMLVEEFEEPRGWPTLARAREEVATVLREGFARVALEGSDVLGWVGGLPEYAGRVWELHPMVVRRAYRRRGIGRALAAVFEAEAASRGGLTATLGTDDDSGMTSLADVDLYENTAQQIAELRDLGRGHPFMFYRRLGYVVTGVMPDANGVGRPDIYMSKRLQSGG